MKQFTLLLTLAILSLWSCKSDDEMVVTDPEISLTADIDLSQAACVNIPFQIKVDLRTNADIGIDIFSITKNGTETLIEENAIIPNNLVYTFNYSASNEDLEQGNIEFTFSLTDKDGATTTEVLLLDIVNEYAFLLEVATPDPSWDLVKNEAVSVEDGANVDFFMTTDTEPCGFGCLRYRFTFTSKNETQFYALPYNSVVSPFSRDLKQDVLLSEISGITPVKELVVYSTFPADVTATGELNNLPVVAQIRGTDEYALIERLPSQPGSFYYRKRSANAGGN